MLIGLKKDEELGVGFGVVSLIESRVPREAVIAGLAEVERSAS